MNRGEKSAAVQVRISFEDMATITDFVIRSGFNPGSSGKSMSIGVSSFADILRGNKLANDFNLDDSIRFLEQLGFFSSMKISKRAVRQQMSAIKVGDAKPHPDLPDDWQQFCMYVEDEMKAGGTPLRYPEWKAMKMPKMCYPEGLVVGSEITVPADEDSLLSQLEQGKPKVED